jgi:anti-anti-sigma factor
MLEVEIVATTGGVICAPKGNLDATTVTTFTGAVALCLGEPGLIIDLTGVRFMDGAALTAVVGAARRAQDHMARVALVVPAGRLRRVFDETGFGVIVSISETVDRALAGVGNDGQIAGCHHLPLNARSGGPNDRALFIEAGPEEKPHGESDRGGTQVLRGVV